MVDLIQVIGPKCTGLQQRNHSRLLRKAKLPVCPCTCGRYLFCLRIATTHIKALQSPYRPDLAIKLDTGQFPESQKFAGQALDTRKAPSGILHTVRDRQIPQRFFLPLLGTAALNQQSVLPIKHAQVTKNPLCLIRVLVFAEITHRSRLTALHRCRNARAAARGCGLSAYPPTSPWQWDCSRSA